MLFPVYYAMCAQTATVFTRYLFLAVSVREDSGLRSSGLLFCPVADEISDISFAATFVKLQLLLKKLLEGFIPQKKEICALVVDFLEGLSADMKRFPDFEGSMGTSSSKMGREICELLIKVQYQVNVAVDLSPWIWYHDANISVMLSEYSECRQKYTVFLDSHSAECNPVRSVIPKAKDIRPFDLLHLIFVV